MSAFPDISRLLGQWLEYTEAESAAIQASAWPSLKEIQKAKAGLQKSMTAALGRWTKENPGIPAAAPASQPYRAEVNRLIALEARNSQLLSAKMDAARKEQRSREGAMRNLRKVHRSYGRKPDAGWHSFS